MTLPSGEVALTSWRRPRLSYAATAPGNAAARNEVTRTRRSRAAADPGAVRSRVRTQGAVAFISLASLDTHRRGGIAPTHRQRRHDEHGCGGDSRDQQRHAPERQFHQHTRSRLCGLSGEHDQRYDGTGEHRAEGQPDQQPEPDQQ